MAASDERLEQLEQALQQAGTALQAANYRIAALEASAGAPATLRQQLHLSRWLTCTGDEASWKSWSFVMLSFSAAVSPDLRALMEKARTAATDMRNVSRCGAGSAQPEHEWRGAEETAERARG